MKKSSQSGQPLSQRVRRTLNDLAVIQQSLMETAGHEADPSGPNQLMDLELAAELKSVVDALRRLLWAYIQVLSSGSGREPQEVLEWYKMEIAVDMLRSIRSRNSSNVPPDLDKGSFDQLVSQALAITAMHAKPNI
jgi:hypothetical protein